MNFQSYTKRFQFFGTASILLIYLVILAGAVVRGTGAGMGCPDWPKCFGLWIPPTDISQLPLNYQELFSSGGSVLVEPFNPTKTWTEYINRLVGALSGVFVLLMTVFSFLNRKNNAKGFYFSFATLLLLMFQGWLGAKVVATNLSPHMITYHMVLAMVIVGGLMYSLSTSYEVFPHANFPKYFLWILLLLFFVQLVLGTNVREQVDKVMKANQYGSKEIWIDTLDWKFYVHRSFSILVLLVSTYLFRKSTNEIRKHLSYNLIGIFVLIFTGVLFNYFQFPFLSQPIHLLVSTILIGNIFYLLLFFRFQSE